MHSTDSSKTVALRFKSLALVAVLLPSATVEAGGLMPVLERAGRFFGVGYSDGYHVCKPDYDSPCADLPIRREQESCLDAVGNHGPKECDSCGRRTEIVECEGGSCFTRLRSHSNCDQPSCDAASCDGPACYATSPFPAYASTGSQSLPEQAVPLANAPSAQPEFSTTQFIEPQVVTNPDVAEDSQSDPMRQSPEIEPQQSIMPSRFIQGIDMPSALASEFGDASSLNQLQAPAPRSSNKQSRMIRPIEVVPETGTPEPVQKESASLKRRPKRL